MNIECESIGKGSIEHQDVLLWICVCSDDVTLQRLSQTGLWTIMREFVSKQYFWYLRTQFLVKRPIQTRQEDWKSTYYILSVALTDANPFNERTSKNLLCLRVLSEVGFIPESNALLSAVEADNIEAVRFILQHRIEHDEDDDNYILTLAAENNQVEVLSVLIEEAKMDPSYFHSLALELAVCGEALESIVRLLEDERIDPTDKDNLVLSIALERGCKDIIDILLADRRVRARYDNLDVLIRDIEANRIEISNSDDEDVPDLDVDRR